MDVKLRQRFCQGGDADIAELLTLFLNRVHRCYVPIAEYIVYRGLDGRLLDMYGPKRLDLKLLEAVAPHFLHKAGNGRRADTTGGRQLRDGDIRDGHFVLNWS